MMRTNVIRALRGQIAKPFDAELEAVNCHHNYVQRENHFGENVLVTRKGAVRAAKGVLGIIPGSMGAKSFIVRGLGNAESFDSCSHGAGRVMSRTAAKKLVTLDEHIRDTAGVECRKDEGVIDETPKAYKPIEAVMAAQADLVEIVHTLKQVVCVKGQPLSRRHQGSSNAKEATLCRVRHRADAAPRHPVWQGSRGHATRNGGWQTDDPGGRRVQIL